MPDGGTLSFSAWAVDNVPPEAGAERLAAGHNGCVAISIRDTGAGMSDAVKQRALEPFFTTKETGRGTGLGLSTVFGLMDQSHGAMVLDSALGVGTTITLFLPQHRAAEVDSGDVATPVRVPPGLRVLLVEDDAEVCAVAQRFLAAADCEATACVNGEQAIALLALLAARDGGAPFDCCSPTSRSAPACAVRSLRARHGSCRPRCLCCSRRAFPATCLRRLRRGRCCTSPTAVLNWRRRSRTRYDEQSSHLGRDGPRGVNRGTV